jgi:hypothetical protein
VLSLLAAVRIYPCTVPTDLRRGFDGLAAMTRNVLAQDPLSGHLVAFCNRRAYADRRARRGHRTKIHKCLQYIKNDRPEGRSHIYMVAGAGFDTDSPDSWEWEDIQLTETAHVAG